MNENLLIALSGTVISSVTGLIIWVVKRDFSVYKKVLEIESSMKVMKESLDKIHEDLKDCQSIHVG